MSQQSSTASNTPAEPVLCAMGCGFFVSMKLLVSHRYFPLGPRVKKRMEHDGEFTSRWLSID